MISDALKLFKNKFSENKKLNYFIAGLCAAFAFAIASPSLHFPFHPDEGISLCKINMSRIEASSNPVDSSLNFHESFFNRHQPLYFSLLTFFTQIGGHEKIALKTFNLVIYSLGYFLFFFLAQSKLRNSSFALLLTCLMALFPSLIYYSTYIHSYALLFTISILQLIFFNKLYEKNDERLTKWCLYFYLFTSLILMYIHIYSSLILLFQIFILFKEKVILQKTHKQISLIAFLIFVFYNFTYLHSIDYGKLKQLFLAATFPNSIIKYFNILLYLFEDGYSTDHPLIYQIFPLFFSLSLFISFFIFFKKNRRLDFTKASYDFFSTLFVLISFFCLIYLFSENNLESGDVIFLIPSLFLIFSTLLQKLKNVGKKIFWGYLVIYMFLNVYNFRMTYFYAPKGNMSLENVLSFIRTNFKNYENDNSKIIYTNDLRKARCQAIAYYESLYFPEKLNLRSTIELSEERKLAPHFIILFDGGKYDFKSNKITASIVEPMNQFVLYFINGN